MLIGIDLDNTLICYDHAFRAVAKRSGLLPEAFAGDKAAVKRALLAQRPDGFLWERLQGLVYGRDIEDATLFDGVEKFVAGCRSRRHRLVVVSHKTELAHHDPERTNLRSAALCWMNRRGFFDRDRLGLQRTDVFFEATREDKVRRIAALATDLFIDDLAEVLGHPDMPADCRKILFGTQPQDRFEQYASWPELCDAFFAGS